MITAFGLMIAVFVGALMLAWKYKSGPVALGALAAIVFMLCARFLP